MRATHIIQYNERNIKQKNRKIWKELSERSSTRRSELCNDDLNVSKQWMEFHTYRCVVKDGKDNRKMWIDSLKDSLS